MRKMIIILAFSGIAGVSYSQTFMHGADASFSSLRADSYGSSIASTDKNLYVALGYKPRFSFFEGKNSSLSVGLPVSVGIGLTKAFSSSSSYYGVSENDKFTYMVNAPLMIDFNYGVGAHDKTESRFGGFAGVGFGIFHGTVPAEFYDYYSGTGYIEVRKITTACIAGNIGFRIETNGFSNAEIKLHYMKGLTGGKPVIFGIGVGTNF